MESPIALTPGDASPHEDEDTDQVTVRERLTHAVQTSIDRRDNGGPPEEP